MIALGPARCSPSSTSGPADSSAGWAASCPGYAAAVLPKDGSPGRRILGLGGGAAFLVATTALTGAVTTFVGTQTFL